MKMNDKMKNSRMGRFLRRLLGEEKGAVAMEYIVIALLVGAAVVGLVIAFSGGLQNMWGGVTDATNAKNVSETDAAAKAVNEGRGKVKAQNKAAKDVAKAIADGED